MGDGESRRWASDTIGTCEVEVQTMTGALGDGVSLAQRRDSPSPI